MDKKFALKVVFLKEKDMVYFSQLDIFRLLIRALRRTNLPIAYTCGFNPHPKISLGEALKLGKEGEIKATFYFEKKIGSSEFKAKFSEQIPEGLRIINIE